VAAWLRLFFVLFFGKKSAKKSVWLTQSVTQSPASLEKCANHFFLEISLGESLRGFESHPLRQLKTRRFQRLRALLFFVPGVCGGRFELPRLTYLTSKV